ncbi:plastocyanin/azurin family copper-binding protein [Saliphagus infecundisoli]|uniref:Plastocyanin/azurin family copper-binding protein n=1 Tax=Saliphagus infecundisoli TaxID=1849069 RepID=A0ABD5QCH6_9EURY|nr:plastocyanin/azurin family copper-binding protein [Saliphagus infecundisoli]
MYRRELLKAVSGVLGAGVATTAMAPAGAQENANESGGEEGGGEATGNGTGGGNESTGNETGGDGGGATETVNVVDNAFEPEELAIEPGTTVQWAWQGTQAQHNVHPTSQPGEANWEGHMPLESGDFSFQSTFDVEGEYEYQCDPHASLGMVGTVTVSPDAGTTAEGPIQLVPDAAWTLVIATVAGMLATLSLAYAFIRYGGSNPSSSPER